MTDLLQLPLISFVVTSYNYEKFIVKTLRSIKEQTYPNFEIIVVDDVSSDSSVEVVNKFIDENPDLDIKLIEHEQNLGQMAAIQTGLNYSNGVFVSFIDSDDVLVKDYAKTLIRVHLSSSVAVASAQVVEIGLDDEIHTMYSVSSFQKELSFELKSLQGLLDVDVENVDFKVLNLKNAHFGGWWWSAMSANMFRKSALELFLDYDTPQNWMVCPDKFLLNFVHLIGGSAIVYAPLVGYRRHGLNAGNCASVCGLKRYHNDKTSRLNIENNKKIRQDTLKFIFKNRARFNSILGRKNVRKLILEIFLSYFRIDVRKIF